MRLTYSILWFDDDQSSFESIDLDYVRDELYSLGFTLKVVPVHNSESFNSYTPFKDFDMIIVDFNLGDEQGDTFIEKVRNNDVYSEIIFYSFTEASDLWKAIHDRQLEGVFVTNKKSIETKVARVARQSVRKVLDLENMRGIVMSEVGDLDALLEDIFIRAMNALPEKKQHEVFCRFHEKTGEQHGKFSESLAAFKQTPSIEGLLALCDSDKRWQNFNRVKKHHELLNSKKLEGDYSQEILWPRNCLAHGRPERCSDGSLMFRHSSKEYLFDEDISQKLRKRIIEYKNALTEILSFLD